MNAFTLSALLAYIYSILMSNLLDNINIPKNLQTVSSSTIMPCSSPTSRMDLNIPYNGKKLAKVRKQLLLLNSNIGLPPTFGSSPRGSSTIYVFSHWSIVTVSGGRTTRVAGLPRFLFLSYAASSTF